MSHLVAGVKWIWVRCDVRYDSVRARKLFMFRDHDENCSMCLIFLRWKRREKKSITSTHPEGHGWYVPSLSPSSGFYLIAIITDEMLEMYKTAFSLCALEIQLQVTANLVGGFAAISKYWSTLTDQCAAIIKILSNIEGHHLKRSLSKYIFWFNQGGATWAGDKGLCNFAAL